MEKRQISLHIEGTLKTTLCWKLRKNELQYLYWFKTVSKESGPTGLSTKGVNWKRGFRLSNNCWTTVFLLRKQLYLSFQFCNDNEKRV